MGPSTVTPETFTCAVAGLRPVSPRPEISLDEVPAPQRLAPYSYALAGTVLRHGDEVATGRLILLYDPSCPEAWEGPLRLVTYVTARLELAGRRAGVPWRRAHRHRRHRHTDTVDALRRAGRAAGQRRCRDPGILDTPRRRSHGAPARLVRAAGLDRRAAAAGRDGAAGAAGHHRLVSHDPGGAKPGHG